MPARTVIIGAEFIGSEIASSARERGLPVTILKALSTPLVQALGEEAGAALSGQHLRNGTICGAAPRPTGWRATTASLRCGSSTAL